MKKLVFFGVLAALISGPALAQNFPSRDIRFINGFPAGGTSAERGATRTDKVVRVSSVTGAVIVLVSPNR